MQGSGRHTRSGKTAVKQPFDERGVMSPLSMEMAFAEDDDMVETFPPHGSHEAFSKGILPRRPRCGETFVDANAQNATTELVAENA